MRTYVIPVSDTELLFLAIRQQGQITLFEIDGRRRGHMKGDTKEIIVIIYTDLFRTISSFILLSCKAQYLY
jgi:hypothetical protein